MKWIGKIAGLPEDAVGRIPRVVMLGRSKVMVYNAEKLEKFTDETVLIQLLGGSLHIQGKSLEVKELLPAEVIIEGAISMVCMKEKHVV